MNRLSFARFRQSTPLHFLLALTAVAGGCATNSCQVGKIAPRTGDEIVACGQFFHTGTPVVLWIDPGGYDAYRVERRFAPFDQSDFQDSLPSLSSPRTPNRYSARRNG